MFNTDRSKEVGTSRGEGTWYDSRPPFFQIQYWAPYFSPPWRQKGYTPIFRISSSSISRRPFSLHNVSHSNGSRLSCYERVGMGTLGRDHGQFRQSALCQSGPCPTPLPAGTALCDLSRARPGVRMETLILFSRGLSRDLTFTSMEKMISSGFQSWINTSRSKCPSP
jgi:hypothetical protein